MSLSPTHVRTEFLDHALRLVDQGAVEHGLDLLYEGLVNRRADDDLEDWQAFVREHVQPHPLTGRIHRDPIARRSFEKPRGYAGDAVLLDYIYGLEQPDPSDALAQAIYAYGRTRPACLGVRRRRARIAEWIDAAAAELGRPLRVLSVASGHLREAQTSRACLEGGVVEYVALDADAASCAVVEREQPRVTVLEAPFTSLYRDATFTPRFDLVYSAGLYDYLEERVAAKLSARLFQLLAPGGRLLLTNFLTTNSDAAYMEAFMDWTLIYRERHEVEAFAARIPANEIAKRVSSTDSHLAVGFLELVRA